MCVEPFGCVRSCRLTLHKKLLPIRHVMESTPLRAETGIAQDARATRAYAGSRRANGSFCPLARLMPSSLCHRNWLRSPCRTKG